MTSTRPFVSRRMDNVADVDLANAGDAIDRRRQLGVAQIRPRLLDDAFIGLHHGLKLGQLGLRGVDELAACPTVLVERKVSVEIGLGIVDLGLIAIAIGDRLVELRLIRTRIDLGEEIALLDRLPLREGDLDELAGDLAAHDYVVIGDDRADAAQVDRYVVLEHRSWQRPARPPAGRLPGWGA